jgi:hypothetical protein
VNRGGHVEAAAMKVHPVTAVVVLVICGAIAYALGTRFGCHLRPDSCDDSAALTHEIIDGLAVDLKDLELGEVWEEGSFFHELPIHNQNETPVKVLDFQVSCGCVAVEPHALSIPAGQTGTIQLKLDLTHRKPGEIGLAARPFALEVRPVTKRAQPSQAGWHLHGAIKSRVALDSLALDFGEFPIRGQSACSRTVVATVQPPTSQAVVTFDRNVLAVQTKRRATSSDQYELTIAPLPTLESGRFESSVDVDVRTAEGKRLSGVRFPVSGNMQPEVRPLPARVVFGARKIGETAESTVTLQQPASQEWTIDHIELESSDVDVEEINARERSLGRCFRVRQRIVKEGQQTNVVRFTVRQGKDKSIVVPMEVAYYGDATGELSVPKAKEATNDRKLWPIIACLRLLVRSDPTRVGSGVRTS